MNIPIERIRAVRAYLMEQVKDLSIDQLNKIPAGLNNNIAWHLGHIIAAQQGICYMRAGLKPMVTNEYFMRYKPGTVPEHDISISELEEIKELSVSTIERLDADYESKLFTDYPSWTTRYNVEISGIDDAVEFLGFHEGYHAGCVSIISKLVV